MPPFPGQRISINQSCRPVALNTVFDNDLTKLLANPFRNQSPMTELTTSLPTKNDWLMVVRESVQLVPN